MAALLFWRNAVFLGNPPGVSSRSSPLADSWPSIIEGPELAGERTRFAGSRNAKGLAAGLRHFIRLVGFNLAVDRAERDERGSNPFKRTSSISSTRSSIVSSTCKNPSSNAIARPCTRDQAKNTAFSRSTGSSGATANTPERAPRTMMSTSTALASLPAEQRLVGGSDSYNRRGHALAQSLKPRSGDRDEQVLLLAEVIVGRVVAHARATGHFAQWRECPILLLGHQRHRGIDQGVA